MPLIVAAAAALRLPGLGQSLWFDELSSTRLLLSDGWKLLQYSLLDTAPPFYSVFMYAWTAIFGDSTISIRLPPLLLGIAAVPLTAALCAQLSDKKTGLLAASLLAASPTHIHYSQEARPYGAMAFFLLMALYAYRKLEDAPQRRTWLAVHGVSIICLTLSHYYAVLFPLLFSAFSLSRPIPSRRPLLLIYASATSVFAACGVLQHNVIPLGELANRGAHYLKPFNASRAWSLLFEWFPFGNSLSWWLPRPILLPIQAGLACLLFLGIRPMLWETDPPRRRRCLEALSLFISLPVLLWLLPMVGMRHTYIERAAFVVAPISLMLLSRGWAAIARPRLRAAVLALLASAQAAALAALWADPWRSAAGHRRPDWRSAAGYLTGELGGEGRQTVALAAAPTTVLTYYDPFFFQEADAILPQERPDAVRSALARRLGERHPLTSGFAASVERREKAKRKASDGARLLTVFVWNAAHEREAARDACARAETKTVLLVHREGWGNARSARIKRRLLKNGRCRLVESRSFRGVTLHKFRLASDP